MVKNREFVRTCTVNHCHFNLHKFVNVVVDVPKLRLNPTVIQSRSINRVDVHSLNSDLLAVDWADVLNAESMSHQWQAFLHSFLPVFDDHAFIKSLTMTD